MKTHKMGFNFGILMAFVIGMFVHLSHGVPVDTDLGVKRDALPDTDKDGVTGFYHDKFQTADPASIHDVLVDFKANGVANTLYTCSELNNPDCRDLVFSATWNSRSGAIKNIKLYDGNALMCVGPDGTLNGNHDTVHWFYCAGSIHGFIRGDRSEIAYAYVGQHYRLRIGTYDLGLGDGTAWLLGSDARLPLPENIGKRGELGAGKPHDDGLPNVKDPVKAPEVLETFENVYTDDANAKVAELCAGLGADCHDMTMTGTYKSTSSGFAGSGYTVVENNVTRCTLDSFTEPHYRDHNNLNFYACESGWAAWVRADGSEIAFGVAGRNFRYKVLPGSTSGLPARLVVTPNHNYHIISTKAKKIPGVLVREAQPESEPEVLETFEDIFAEDVDAKVAELCAGLGADCHDMTVGGHYETTPIGYSGIDWKIIENNTTRCTLGRFDEPEYPEHWKVNYFACEAGWSAWVRADGSELAFGVAGRNFRYDHFWPHGTGDGYYGGRLVVTPVKNYCVLPSNPPHPPIPGFTGVAPRDSQPQPVAAGGSGSPLPNLFERGTFKMPTTPPAPAGATIINPKSAQVHPVTFECEVDALNGKVQKAFIYLNGFPWCTWSEYKFTSNHNILHWHSYCPPDAFAWIRDDFMEFAFAMDRVDYRFGVAWNKVNEFRYQLRTVWVSWNEHKKRDVPVDVDYATPTNKTFGVSPFKIGTAPKPFATPGVAPLDPASVPKEVLTNLFDVNAAASASSLGLIGFRASYNKASRQFTNAVIYENINTLTAKCFLYAGQLTGDHNSVTWLPCLPGYFAFIRNDMSEVAYARDGQDFRFKLKETDLGNNNFYIQSEYATIPAPGTKRSVDESSATGTAPSTDVAHNITAIAAANAAQYALPSFSADFDGVTRDATNVVIREDNTVRCELRSVRLDNNPSSRFWLSCTPGHFAWISGNLDQVAYARNQQNLRFQNKWDLFGVAKWHITSQYAYIVANKRSVDMDESAVAGTAPAAGTAQNITDVSPLTGTAQNVTEVAAGAFDTKNVTAIASAFAAENITSIALTTAAAAETPFFECIFNGLTWDVSPAFIQEGNFQKCFLFHVRLNAKPTTIFWLPCNRGYYAWISGDMERVAYARDGINYRFKLNWKIIGIAKWHITSTLAQRVPYKRSDDPEAEMAQIANDDWIQKRDAVAEAALAPALPEVLVGLPEASTELVDSFKNTNTNVKAALGKIRFTGIFNGVATEASDCVVRDENDNVVCRSSGKRRVTGDHNDLWWFNCDGGRAAWMCMDLSEVAFAQFSKNYRMHVSWNDAGWGMYYLYSDSLATFYKRDAEADASRIHAVANLHTGSVGYGHIASTPVPVKKRDALPEDSNTDLHPGTAPPGFVSLQALNTTAASSIMNVNAAAASCNGDPRCRTLFFQATYTTNDNVLQNLVLSENLKAVCRIDYKIFLLSAPHEFKIPMDCKRYDNRYIAWVRADRSEMYIQRGEKQAWMMGLRTYNIGPNVNIVYGSGQFLAPEIFVRDAAPEPEPQGGRRIHAVVDGELPPPLDNDNATSIVLPSVNDPQGHVRAGPIRIPADRIKPPSAELKAAIDASLASDGSVDFSQLALHKRATACHFLANYDSASAHVTRAVLVVDGATRCSAGAFAVNGQHDALSWLGCDAGYFAWVRNDLSQVALASDADYRLPVYWYHTGGHNWVLYTDGHCYFKTDPFVGGVGRRDPGEEGIDGPHPFYEVKDVEEED